MILSCRFLIDVAGVNSFEITDTIEWFGGDVRNLDFQLVDISVDRAIQGFSPAGRRYMPAAGATMVVTLGSVNDANKVSRVATQPFATDSSIWRVPILATDPMKGTVSFKVTLTEGATVKTSTVAPGQFIRVL